MIRNFNSTDDIYYAEQKKLDAELDSQKTILENNLFIHDPKYQEYKKKKEEEARKYEESLKEAKKAREAREANKIVTHRPITTPDHIYPTDIKTSGLLAELKPLPRNPVRLAKLKPLPIYQTDSRTPRYPTDSRTPRNTNTGGKNNNKPQKDKVKKYKAYLSKYTVEKLKKIAVNKKLKVTSKSDKASLIKRLVKYKFM